MTPTPSTFWTRRTIIIVSASILVFCCVATTIIGLNSPTKSTSTTAIIAHTPSITITATHVPTNTVVVIPTIPSTSTAIPPIANTVVSTAIVPTAIPVPLITDATLGGTDSAFAQQYTHLDSSLYTLQQGAVTIGLNDDTGTDGQQRAFELLIYRTDASLWSLSEAQTICTLFSPPDARFERNVTASDGSLQQIYRSSMLGATFPASSFSGASVGEYSIHYEYPNTNKNGIFQCQISIGGV